MSRILLTGATGFVGAHLLSRLAQQHSVLCAGRTEPTQRCDHFYPWDISAASDLSGMFEKEVDIVCHCAARVHVINEKNSEADKLYNTVNVEATRGLAIAAREAGVKRFIFLSSVKVLGEATIPNQAYTNESGYSPEDLYGKSKRDAEQALKQELSGSGTDLVIIRPPLVYGPGVKANFKSLMEVAKRNLPLPLKSVDNRRSLVALDNLVDLIVTCVEHSGPLNETFLVSDDHDVSTKELLEALTQAYGKQPRLWPFPVSVMHMAAGLLGKKSVADRLFGNLQLDISHTKRTLNWKPKVSFEQAIRDCVTFDLESLNQDIG